MPQDALYHQLPDFEQWRRAYPQPQCWLVGTNNDARIWATSPGKEVINRQRWSLVAGDSAYRSVKLASRCTVLPRPLLTHQSTTTTKSLQACTSSPQILCTGAWSARRHGKSCGPGQEAEDVCQRGSIEVCGKKIHPPRHHQGEGGCRGGQTYCAGQGGEDHRGETASDVRVGFSHDLHGADAPLKDLSGWPWKNYQVCGQPPGPGLCERFHEESPHSHHQDHLHDKEGKGCRVSIKVEEEFFKRFAKSAEGVPPTHIYVYSSGLKVDLGADKAMFQKGVKHAEQIRDHTKSRISVMFCGNCFWQTSSAVCRLQGNQLLGVGGMVIQMVLDTLLLLLASLRALYSQTGYKRFCFQMSRNFEVELKQN